MNCREARARLLAGEEDVEVDQHVSSCPRCAEDVEQLVAMRATLADDAVWGEASLDLEDQIVNLISPAVAQTRRRSWRWAVAAALIVVVAGSAALLQSRTTQADWQTVLVGEGIAVGSTVTVEAFEHSRGTELVLTPTGLPAAPEGSYYELWFANDDSIVSAGTFATGFPVTLYIAALREDYPRMGVTIEKVDDDPSSSRNVVLRQP
ncbi:MAG: anti-sigma factor [Acidimicrobiia bacterium]|nr:anti-sigma factor [Acidimicrobiia bacterium]NNF65329.1 anti-sigma factor [Acidimicrobiia bacterium]